MFREFTVLTIQKLTDMPNLPPPCPFPAPGLGRGRGRGSTAIRYVSASTTETLSTTQLFGASASRVKPVTGSLTVKRKPMVEFVSFRPRKVKASADVYTVRYVGVGVGVW